MQYRVIAAQDLTADHDKAWRAIVAKSAELDSPYMHPEFTRCVAAVRPDVEVCVLEDRHDVVGFFPFQRVGRNEARPIGGRLNDCHGVIADPDVAWDLDGLLKSCRLAAFDFHYLQPNDQFTPHATRSFESAYLDLSAGFENYVAGLNSKRFVSETNRKRRKVEREVGPIRFEWNSADRSAFEQLLAWKSAQYVRSGIADVMSFGWTVELLEEIWSRQGDDFAGLLSTVHAGDRLVAVHFGVQAGGVLHQWFPAYDVELSNYSPGLFHLLQMAEFAAESGVTRIDLGEVCDYKARVMSASKTMAEGSIDHRVLRRMIRTGYQRTRDWVKNSPLRGPAQIPGRWIRQLCERWEFR